MGRRSDRLFLGGGRGGVVRCLISRFYTSMQRLASLNLLTALRERHFSLFEERQISLSLRAINKCQLALLLSIVSHLFVY